MKYLGLQSFRQTRDPSSGSHSPPGCGNSSRYSIEGATFLDKYGITGDINSLELTSLREQEARRTTVTTQEEHFELLRARNIALGAPLFIAIFMTILWPVPWYGTGDIFQSVSSLVGLWLRLFWHV